MKKAVLFDLDGVLLNSMPYHVQAWQDILKEYDVHLKPNEIYSREGTRTAELVRLIAKDHELNLSDEELDQIAQEKSLRYNQITKADIMPGVEDLIEVLKRKSVFIAIVTSTFLENLKKVMPKAILNKFDMIITGGDVEKGKPHPEPYQKAAQKLGVPPSDCVVIENAALGVQSAKAAGMECIAVTSTQSKDQLKQADRIYPDLLSIAQQLDEILQ